MTTNQLAYWANQEIIRANLAKEQENRRSNLAKEAETQRHNVESEKADRWKAASSAVSAAGAFMRGTSSVVKEVGGLVPNVIKLFV